MAANQISRRIYDFLKDIPPFVFLDRDALFRISERAEVHYLPAGQTVFTAGQAHTNFFYLIREGAVDLVEAGSEEEVLVERCGEGELFGIRPILADDAYVLTARAAEETLLYAVNTVGLLEQLDKYPQVSYYLASTMARGRFGWSERKPQRPTYTMAGQSGFPVGGLLELQSVHRAKEPVTCSPDIPIFAAAEIMTEHDVGSIIIVNDQQHPLGIMTDRDIRRDVATGVYGRKRFIREVMSTPVVCIHRDVVVAEVQIAMVKFDIHHLVVTEDGTNQSPIVGVISEHDLLVLQGNNPAVLVREIARASSATYLRELRIRAEYLLRQYLEQDVNITFITTIMTEINDGIIRRCIELSLAEMEESGMGKPPAKFAFMSLGSQGRGEQLLRTDQDSALVFADQPPEQYEAVKSYFIEASSKVAERLFAVGYAYCPGNMMASNPKWCLSVGQWKGIFSAWMKEPNAENMLNVSVFFDYRSVYGDDELTQALTDHIFVELEQTKLFQAFLAKSALQNPAPLTFFRNFMVEKSGEHKDQFDLKARAMMPLTDAARVLILEAQAGGINNTIKRFLKMAELEPQNAELYQSAAEAYEFLIRLRALFGLRRQDNGRYLKPSELSRLQRILLRNTFTPVSEIQQLLTVRFQTNFLR
ncbi:MAG: DUF294 nucleotidyltransferase-like domain-containing protein [Bacteroidota bacterium]